MTKKVIGLDVSSSCVGFSVFNYDKAGIALLQVGHIKPPDSKKGSIIFRVFEYVKELRKLLATEKPNAVSIENFASGFSAGRTTAKTIVILATFNSITQMVVLESLGYEAEMLAVSTIRSIISKHLGAKSVSKEEMLDVITKQFSSQWKPRITKNGTIGAESLDESDGIAAGWAYCLLHQKD